MTETIAVHGPATTAPVGWPGHSLAVPAGPQFAGWVTGRAPWCSATTAPILAKAAIAEAGQQLPAGRDALVLTVWRTFNVEFVPETGMEFDAACGDEVRQAAEQTAAHGALPAEAAGFQAQAVAVEGTPTWKAITDAAADHDVSLIVLGSRGDVPGSAAW
jgi:hypothetical protein